MDYEKFIKERVYLHNVSPRTVQWYRESFKWLAALPLTHDGLKDLVIKMRQGSQFHLMKILGHTSMEMTRKYVDLQTQDLQTVHNRLSPLSPEHLKGIGL